MLAWLLLIVWLILIMVGEFRFNGQLKARAKHESRNRRYSSDLEEAYERPSAGTRHDTVVQPIRFKFDEMDTEETGAVYDIRERYPNEFA